MEGVTAWVLIMLLPLVDGGINYKGLQFETEEQCQISGFRWQVQMKVYNPTTDPQFHCIVVRHPLPEPGQTKSGYTAV